MTLCDTVSVWMGEMDGRITHHFKSPDTPDPHFQLSIDTVDAIEL